MDRFLDIGCDVFIEAPHFKIDASCALPPFIPQDAVNDDHAFPTREVFVCYCGSWHFELRPEGAFCASCGKRERGWSDPGGKGA